MNPSKNLTYPFDYAPILSGPEGEQPVIVGGQAVNLWASVYMPAEKSRQFGSIDLDILATPRIVRWMSEISGWAFTPALGDDALKLGQITKKADDGTVLHVEALSRVLGLDADDLKAVVELKLRDIRFLTLDPVALMKAKCANVNELAQGAGERHDMQHLKILGECVPAYLREMAAGGVKEETTVSSLRRLFAMMGTPANGGVLWEAGIAPEELVPREFFAAPALAQIRALCEKRMPVAREACKPENYQPKFKPAQNVAPAMSPASRRKGRTMRNF